MKNRVKDLEENNIAYFIKSRGDGNCFYRSVMNSYIILLIQTSMLENFINQ